MNEQMLPAHPFEFNDSPYDRTCKRCGMGITYHDSAIIKEVMTLAEYNRRYPSISLDSEVKS